MSVPDRSIDNRLIKAAKKEFLEKELAKANKKLEDSGSMSGDDLSYIDKLSHSIKSIKTTMAMMDAEEGNYSYDGGYSNEGHGGYSNDGHMGGTSGRRYDNRYPGRSYARGRGSNAKRDSMGRYSRSDGQEEFIEQLREVMQDAPDDKTRREMERMITKLEG